MGDVPNTFVDSESNHLGSYDGAVESFCFHGIL